MARSTKPRKKYVPKWNAGKTLRTEPWKVAAVFGPVESILDRLERDGEISIDPDDRPLFNDQIDGNHYALAPSMRGLTDAFDLHRERQGKPLVSSGLLGLVSRLESGDDIDQADIDAARKSVAAMRADALEMSGEYAAGLVKTCQIKFEMEALRA